MAASNGGQLVVAFVSGGGAVHASCGRPARRATPRSQPIAEAGLEPVRRDVDQRRRLPHLVAPRRCSGRAAGAQRHDVQRRARPAGHRPGRDAGTGTGRPKVAVAADGIATVVWGEGGHAYARRIFELRLSAAPQDLGEGADEPDISSEDDSSFAWAVFRQGGQAIARRLVGSAFDPPVPIEGGEAPDTARVAINGRGVGYAGVGGSATLGAYGAVLKDDMFNPGAIIGGGFGVASVPVPAVAESGDGLVAFQQGDAAGGRTVHARTYDYVPASRVVTPPGPDATLSDPALGPTDAARGLEAAADRAGDMAVAFVQGDGDARRIVAASYDRAPGVLPGEHDHQVAQVRAPAAEVGDGLRAVGAADLPRGDRRPAGGHHDVDRHHGAEPGARRTASLARGRHRHPRPDRGDAFAQPARRRHPAEDHLQGLGLAQARPAGEGRRAGRPTHRPRARRPRG